ncbi:MAG: LysM peptidoglycan-binding domain-containing M23 family metallopeptidase [Candidatus Omnitrophica bacterium]|nr:LysM peptidoglycan-binding domain-containing M23 family metallopeptidase [Candidatus Omnitrophota bacterium]
MKKGLTVHLLLIILISGMTSCMTFGEKRDVPVVDGVIHEVHEGETINAISKTYEISPQLLIRRNSLREGDALKAGTRLFIPGAQEIRVVKLEEADPVIWEERDGLFHRVGEGETLIAIANAYGLTIQELQRVNNLADPSRIYVDQELWIPRAKEVKDIEVKRVRVVSAEPAPKTAPKTSVQQKTENKSASSSSKIRTITSEPATEPVEKTETETAPAPAPVDFPRKVKEFGPVKFQWPIKDSFKFVRGFSKSSGNLNPGIDLGADIGTEVCAAADGEVLMVGGVTDTLGMRLGNHIIIYHGERNNKEIYTLYAHNSQNLVKIGDKVKRGQAIAKVGDTGRISGFEGGVLHFEVREQIDSIDPLTVLPPLD